MFHVRRIGWGAAAGLAFGTLLVLNLAFLREALPAATRGALIACYTIMGAAAASPALAPRWPLHAVRAAIVAVPGLAYALILGPLPVRHAGGDAARAAFAMALAAMILLLVRAWHRVARGKARGATALPYPGSGPAAIALMTFLPLGEILMQTRWAMYVPSTAGFSSFLAAFAALAWPLVAVGLAGGTARLVQATRMRAAVLATILAGTTVLGMLTPGMWTSAGRRAPAAPAAANVRTPDRPDIIVISLDTVRRDRVSVYHPELGTTPHLEAFARDALMFRNAISTSPWTLPSHGSLFTGLFRSEQHPPGAPTLAAGAYAMPSEVPMLAEELRDAGYVTAGFVANSGFLDPAYGFDRGFDRWFHQQPVMSRDPVVYLTTLRSAAAMTHLRRALGINPVRLAPEVTQLATRWLDEWVMPPRGEARERRGRGTASPFFLFVNLMEAHGIEYLPDTGVMARDRLPPVGRFEQIVQRCSLNRTPVDDATRSTLLAWYDDELRSLDRALGRFLEDLDTRGLLDHAIVVVWADHGEMFGSHAFFGHRTALYDSVLRVPLIMRLPAAFPAGDAPRRGGVDAFVQPVDLHGFLRLAGTGQGRAFALRALTDGAWRERRPWRTAPAPALALAEIANGVDGEPGHGGLADRDMCAIYLRDGASDLLKFTWNSKEDGELVNLTADPREQVSLTASRKEDLARLTTLVAVLSPGLVSPGTGDAPPAGATDATRDEERQTTLRSLGYLH